MFTHVTQCMWGVLDPPVSVFSLSLYRHPYIYILFTSDFDLFNLMKLLKEVWRGENGWKEEVVWKTEMRCRSRGMDIHMSETVGKIKPTDPLRLVKKVTNEQSETDPIHPTVHWTGQMSHDECGLQNQSILFCTWRTVGLITPGVSVPHVGKKTRNVVGVERFCHSET
jgi:hypothetical protein